MKKGLEKGNAKTSRRKGIVYAEKVFLDLYKNVLIGWQLFCCYCLANEIYEVQVCWVEMGSCVRGEVN